MSPFQGDMAHVPGDRRKQLTESSGAVSGTWSPQPSVAGKLTEAEREALSVALIGWYTRSWSSPPDPRALLATDPGSYVCVNAVDEAEVVAGVVESLLAEREASVRAELLHRAVRAEKTLEDLAAKATLQVQEQRLSAKAEGVRLARSYIEEIGRGA